MSGYTHSSGSYFSSTSSGSGSGPVQVNKNKVSLREMMIIALFKNGREKKTLGLKR